MRKFFLASERYKHFMRSLIEDTKKKKNFKVDFLPKLVIQICIKKKTARQCDFAQNSLYLAILSTFYYNFCTLPAYGPVLEIWLVVPTFSLFFQEAKVKLSFYFIPLKFYRGLSSSAFHTMLLL